MAGRQLASRSQLSSAVQAVAMEHGKSLDCVDMYAYTEVPKDTFSFLWRIKSYSKLSSKDEIRSPEFSGGVKNHSWQLKLVPRKKVEDDEYLSLYLMLANFGDGQDPQAKLKVRFQLTLVNAHGEPGKQAGSSTMPVCLLRCQSVLGFDKFILGRDLMSPSKGLLENDSIKIHCKIWIEGNLKHKLITGSASAVGEWEAKRRNTNADDLGSLLLASDFKDVDLVTIKATHFRAHKAVLAARSPVFAAMFVTDMVEQRLNVVRIPDFEYDVVNGMLEYMYTGYSKQMDDRAPELLQIAEKYDLKGLKRHCEHAIAEHLHVDSAAEVLVIAHFFNASILKPRVINFINCHKEECKSTQAFQRVSRDHPEVFVDLYLSQ